MFIKYIDNWFDGKFFDDRLNNISCRNLLAFLVTETIPTAESFITNSTDGWMGRFSSHFTTLIRFNSTPRRRTVIPFRPFYRKIGEPSRRTMIMDAIRVMSPHFYQTNQNIGFLIRCYCVYIQEGNVSRLSVYINNKNCPQYLLLHSETLFTD